MIDLVVLRGGGDLASGVAHRLYRAGFGILICELERPLAVRRTVSFSTAVLAGAIEIENVHALLVRDTSSARIAIADGRIAVLVDPISAAALTLNPVALVDAIMAKCNTGTRITDAPTVVALGPGFRAGVDCHAVVETHRGHHLGRVYYTGSATADTREPNEVSGVTHARVIRAPAGGRFRAAAAIGQRVSTGDEVGDVGGVRVVAQVAGILRGLIATDTFVTAGMKVGDVDPRGDPDTVVTISDKARAVGGGVLEALLHFQHRPM